MTEKNKRLLQIPQGTEMIYLEEAFRHQQAVSEINNLFTGWGYLPVETPLFDFFDIYQDLVAGKERDIYRLIDRDGDLLMLRSDITLFLAKQMGMLLTREDLPKRVYYSGAILRHQNREDISKNEFFQTGIELIGKEGLNADLEVLVLLADTFRLLKIPGKIHVGSMAVIKSLLSSCGSDTVDEVLDGAGSRDFGRIESVIKDTIPDDKRSFIMNLLKFIGTGSEFKTMLEKAQYSPKGSEMENINYILKLMETLERMDMGDIFRIDMSETGNQRYYTGIVFQGYLPKVDSAVASGGRYDTLLDHFGFNAPSVGFSLLLRKIEEHLGSGFSLPEHTKIEAAEFPEAYTMAQKIRSKGGIAIL